MLTFWTFVKIDLVQALGTAHGPHHAHVARAAEVLAEWLNAIIQPT
jgi:hypothetical protein